MSVCAFVMENDRILNIMPSDEDLVRAAKLKMRRPNAGRPPRSEAVPEDIRQLMRLATTKEAHVISQWLRRKMNEHLDEELEVLASHVLSEMDFDPNIPEVMGPMGRGDTRAGLAALISRMKRKVAKLLRDHQRSENDDFLDEVQVVD